MTKTSTTAEFIKKARIIHGNKYNYLKVNYINNHTKVKIICKKHGMFKQEPNSHLQGHNCNKCMEPIRRKKRCLSTEKFIKQAKKVHGNKYDYSNTKYVKAKEKLTIICKKHGLFEQLAFEHKTSANCPRCRNEKLAKERKLTKSEFIERAKKVHGNRYDYSKVNYINSYSKIIIICKKHGKFNQTPDNHLHKNFPQGCPFCKASMGDEYTLTWIFEKDD